MKNYFKFFFISIVMVISLFSISYTIKIGGKGNIVQPSTVSSAEALNSSGTNNNKVSAINNNISNASESESAADVSTSNTTSKSSLTQDNTGSSQIPFGKAVSWGPIKIFKGYVEDLYIKNTVGIGSVSYDIGASTEGTYIYAVNISSGELIGDVKISGRLYAVDICERYAFIWVKDGINIYDLNNKFKFIKNIDESELLDGWRKNFISNFGNYFFVEAREEPDYLIDKSTLQKVDLKDTGLNVSRDDLIYDLLYPDCLIGDPSVFSDVKSGNPAVYSLKERKILGYIPSDILSKVFAWDPHNKLVFCQDRDMIKVYDLGKGDFISELKFNQSEVYSIEAATKSNQKYEFGVGDRLHVIREFLPSENGYYFLNGKDYAYVLDSSAEIKCQLKKSDIIGEFKGYTFYENDDALGINASDCSTLWLNQEPEEPFHGVGPNFTKNSIVWLSDSSRLKGHGDGIYQWSYETGSYLNYTEFTGYEVEILSSDPLILAMRNEEGGVNAGWYLACYNPLKLPFNFIPEINIDYSPDQIYSDTTLVKFVCNVKNLSDEFGSQNISYGWDFGDGEKGSGKEVTHIYGKSGNYNVSVSVRIGDSLDSQVKSEQITVLETPDVELTATPEFYSEVGLKYRLECKTKNAGTIGYVEWDFGDGEKGNGMMVSHAYETGSYIVIATIYNYDKSVSWKKEITINSRFPEFEITSTDLSGYSALSVDFNSALKDTGSTDSGLTYKWKLDGVEVSDEKTFSYVFVDLGDYNVKLEIRDPGSRLAAEKSFRVDVYNPGGMTFSDEGRKCQSNTSIFVPVKYDIDKDGLNQVWEYEAMNDVNPYFELDEGEDWLEHPYDKVRNFVRITPYPSVDKPEYILFFYCIAWTKDYGRYLDMELPVFNIFEAHNGDVEKVVMAWKVIDDKNLELKYVYTSAHGDVGAQTSHSGVWDAVGESTNKGKVKLAPDETMRAALEFQDNRLKLQVSEDKHAIYPTEKCGDDVSLVFGFVGEDCGGGGTTQFVCYNAGEPAVHLMDDIGDIFPNERIWSGNKNKPSKFCGGLEVDDNSPSTIGSNLSGVPSVLKKKIDDELKANS